MNSVVTYRRIDMTCPKCSKDSVGLEGEVFKCYSCGHVVATVTEVREALADSIPPTVLEAEAARLREENLHLREEAGLAAGDDYTMGTFYHVGKHRDDLLVENRKLRKLRWVIGMLLAQCGRDKLRRRYGAAIPRILIQTGGRNYLSEEDWEYALELADHFEEEPEIEVHRGHPRQK
jgi:ribosomal protein L37AE/L43A